MIWITAIIGLIILLLLGIPIPFVFLGIVIYLVFTLGYDPSFLLPYGFSKLNNIVLLAIPLFVLAGGVMSVGGIGEKIVNFAEIFIGKIKSGMGYVTILACAIFGAMSGSAAAALTSIGKIMMPRLLEKGYSKGFASSLIANASVLGLLIPPSSIMILYAWVGNQSVLRAFLSTVGPGILLMIFLGIINFFYMRNNKNVLVKESFSEEDLTFSVKLKKNGLIAVPALLMPVLILGSIYSGIATPTEAAALAVFYAIPVGIWVYKSLKIKSLGTIFLEAATTTGVIMVMLYAIMLFSRIIIMENIPNTIMDILLSISENKFVILLLINLFLIFLGMIMDDVSAVLLATPLLLPIVVGIGIDPIHFAAIIGVNLGMGLLTPPTAPLLYLGGRVGNVQIKYMLNPTLIMLIFAWIPTLLITTYFPAFALFLPNLLLGAK
ncbi:TRAP transporter large permease [Metasolibacillus sp. FSL H7-0170]|uniref:TRAP transporter large permease n=1 Tax=Metasolibacillus sp. FSL H7-0170 TaxID=2921431 RepID=UPI003158A61A